MSFNISKWVLPPPETFSEPPTSGAKVEWFRCVPYIIIHGLILLAFVYPFAWPCLAVCLISYSARMFAITAFYHRYFSHRAFKTNRLVHFIGAFVACCSAQRGPLWWAAHHRRHHRHSDTEKDMHSPISNSLFWSHTLWFMTDYAVPTFLKEIPDKKTWSAIAITFFAAVYIFYDSLQLGSIYGDILGFITAVGLAVGAVTIRSAKKKNLVPAAVVGKLFVAIFAMFFIDSYVLADHDLFIVPLMCVMCVAIPFVMVTIAPRFIPAEEVNLFFLLETIIGPFWVWMIIKEQPSIETIQGGVIIILTIAIHSFLKLKKS